jgi:DNA-binding response OmpR family regulator
LCANANRAVTYREIENYVWRENSMTSDALRSLVRALRRKLPEDCINNLSGIGYLVSLIK